MKALIYNISEYNNLLYAASNNNVEIVCDGIDGWFYVVAEDYTKDFEDSTVYIWLSEKLNITVVDVIIDDCKDKVAIIYK